MPFLRRCSTLAAIAAPLAACGPGAPPPSPFAADAPRLMLFIVVDQLSQEYLVRFRPLLTGGFDFLLDRGVVFVDAHHEHAHTVTGAGHATLATGCFPRRSGIIANQWLDRATGDEVYCVGDREFYRSPANLRVSALGDWLKEMDPESKVFAASPKDRSAVLTGGHRADAALWYGGGDWVTSRYYARPEWLDDFNQRRWLDRYFGRMWRPLAVPQEQLEAAEIVELDEGIYQRAFPYAFGSKSLAPDGDFYDAVLSSPAADAYLAELAGVIIAREQLGADAHPDFLGLSFSALDYVGHEFGPNSREVLDTILRLDRVLAALLDAVDAQVGLENVVVSLSADHGVAPMPEFRTGAGEWGERSDMEDVACFQDAGRQLRERYGDYRWLRADLYLNDDAIDESGVERSDLERQVATLLGRCDSVEHVWTRSELLGEATSSDPVQGDAADEERYRRLFYNGYYPDRSPDFEIQYSPYYLDKISAGTTHGSPYTYDTGVPLIILAPEVRPRVITTRVVTADLAPTLAGIMGIDTPAQLDGTDRSTEVEGADPSRTAGPGGG